MVKKALIVSAIFIFSTLIQLVSQIVITRLFGASLQLDIFLAAVAIPTTIVTVIYGTLNDALLPFLGEKRVTDPKRVDSFFLASLITLTGIVTLATVGFQFFSLAISGLLYQSRGEVFVREVALQLQIMSWSFPLSVFATICGTYFYAHKKLYRFPIVQLIGSLANLFIIIVLVSTLGIWSLVAAFVLNIFLQIFFILPQIDIFRLFNMNLIKNFKFEIKNLFLAWLPLAIGYFALRSDTLIIRSLGSSLPPGYLVYLNLISKIFSLATSVVTIGFQITLLPNLILDFAKKNYVKAYQDVRQAKILTIILAGIVTFSTLALTPILVKILFVGGRFTVSDATVTLTLVPFFILPAVGWGINSIFFQPLIALKKQWELGLLNFFSFVLAWFTGLYSRVYFGTLPAITLSLITLLFTGIIGSEILWQRYKKELLSIKK